MSGNAWNGFLLRNPGGGSRARLIAAFWKRNGRAPFGRRKRGAGECGQGGIGLYRDGLELGRFDWHCRGLDRSQPFGLLRQGGPQILFLLQVGQDAPTAGRFGSGQYLGDVAGFEHLDLFRGRNHRCKHLERVAPGHGVEAVQAPAFCAVEVDVNIDVLDNFECRDGAAAAGGDEREVRPAAEHGGGMVADVGNIVGVPHDDHVAVSRNQHLPDHRGAKILHGAEAVGARANVIGGVGPDAETDVPPEPGLRGQGGPADVFGVVPP